MYHTRHDELGYCGMLFYLFVTLSLELPSWGENLYVPVWQALSGHKRSNTLAVEQPPQARGTGTLIPSMRRLVWAGKPQLGALCDPMDCSLPIYRIDWQSGWPFPSSRGFSEELNALSRREGERVARRTAQGEA